MADRRQGGKVRQGRVSRRRPGGRAVEGIAITPKQTTTLAPGGAFVLLLDIKKHLEVAGALR